MKTNAWIRIAQASVLLGCAAVGCGGSVSSGGGTGGSGGGTGGSGGGSVSSGGGTAAPIAEQDFAGAMAQALCKSIASCCQTSGYPYNASACESALVGGFTVPPGTKYDAQAAGTCVQAIASVASGCEMDSTIQKAVNAACDPVFTGTLPVGQPCTSDLQCAPGPNGEAGLCGYAISSSSGICTVITRAKAGDSCSETCTERSDGSADYSGFPAGAVSCCYTNDGLHCSSSGTCAPQLSTGQSCASSFDCKSGYCDPTTGQCAPPVAVGGACTSDEDCVAGAFCNATEHCEAERSDGAQCTSFNQCKSDQCIQGVCSSALATPALCGGMTSSSSSSGGAAGP